MPKLLHTVPKYRRHKASGQAVVTFNGRDHYLGRHGSKSSREEYDRLLAEWLTVGKCVPPQSAQPPDLVGGTSVVELAAGFMGHALTYCRKPDGTPTNEVKNYRDALRPLKKLYGRTPAAKFDVLRLKAVRNGMIKLGWCRKNVNKQVTRIRSVFLWGAENKLVPASVHAELQALKGLKKGRSDARVAEGSAAFTARGEETPSRRWPSAARRRSNSPTSAGASRSGRRLRRPSFRRRRPARPPARKTRHRVWVPRLPAPRVRHTSGRGRGHTPHMRYTMKRVRLKEPNSGKDDKGRFTQGNTFGRGNPFVHRVGMLRAAMFAEVTPDRMRKVIRTLIRRARRGDVAAIKVLLDRVLGRTTEDALGFIFGDVDTYDKDERFL